MMMRSKAKSTQAISSKHKVYRLDELKAVCEGKGFELIYSPKLNYFTLRQPGTEAWVWIVHPETEDIVKTVRELNQEQWRAVIEFNGQRLQAELDK